MLMEIHRLARRAARARGFAVLLLLTAAIGVGAVVSSASARRAVETMVLPVPAADELVVLRWVAHTGLPRPLGNVMVFKYPGDPEMRPSKEMGATSGMEQMRSSYSFPHDAVDAFTRRQDVFSKIVAFAPIGQAAFSNSQSVVRISALGELARGEMVSPDYFEGLGIRMALGQPIRPADVLAEAPITVISYDFWRRRFGLSRDVTSQTIRIAATSYQIVGVAGEGFRGLAPGVPPDLWIPANDRADSTVWGQPSSFIWSPTSWGWTVLARRQPGVGNDQLRTAAEQAFRRALTQGAREYDGLPNLEVLPGNRGLLLLDEFLATPLRVVRYVEMAIVALCCFNLAALVLVQLEPRRGESALLLALGVSKRSILARFAADVGIVLVAGGLLGVGLGQWGRVWSWQWLSGLVQRWGFILPPPSVDSGAWLTGAAALLTMLLASALVISLWLRAHNSRDITIEARGTVGGRRSRLVAITGMAQIALAVIVTMAAQRFSSEVEASIRRDVGYRPVGLYQISIRGSQKLANEAAIGSFIDLEERLRQSGLTAATAGLLVPPAPGGVMLPASFPDGPTPRMVRAVRANVVGTGFARTIGLRIIDGRDFERGDRGDGARVAMVSRSLARTLTTDRSEQVIGHRVVVPFLNATYSIVGVVSDSVYETASERVGSMDSQVLYVPYSTFPLTAFDGLRFAVRTPEGMEAAARTVRRVVQTVDPTFAIGEIVSSDELLRRTQWKETAVTDAARVLAGLLTLLASFGVYSTLSRVIARLVPELALMRALGAGDRHVLWVAGRFMLLTAVGGLIVGVVGGTWVVRMTTTLLGLPWGGLDAHAFVAGGVIVTLVIIAGCMLPMVRALRIEPNAVLRGD